MRNLIEIEMLWITLFGEMSCCVRQAKIMKIMKIRKFLIFEVLQLSKHSFEGLERCAKAQCSNNLQRRGSEL